MELCFWVVPKIVLITNSSVFWLVLSSACATLRFSRFIRLFFLSLSLFLSLSPFLSLFLLQWVHWSAQKHGKGPNQDSRHKLTKWICFTIWPFAQPENLWERSRKQETFVIMAFDLPGNSYMHWSPALQDTYLLMRNRVNSLICFACTCSLLHPLNCMYPNQWVLNFCSSGQSVNELSPSQWIKQENVWRLSW